MTTVLEIEALSEDMLTENIPCQIKDDYTRKVCGKPAVARIKRPCSCECIARWYFVCAECLENVKEGRVVCANCYQPASEYSWI